MQRDTEPDLKGYVLGEFVFVERIGGGGFGWVWRCEQLSLGRYVAIKVLRREGDAAEARFLREAQLAAKLDHPNVAHVHSFGVDARVGFWIAMELVPGVSLDKWLTTHRRMPPDQLVPFFLDLAGAVAAAHEKGIVHRDLKPANVMVIEQKGKLIPKLLDLGVARGGVHAETTPDDRPAELSAEVRPDDDAGVVVVVDDSPRSTADAASSARPPLLIETVRGFLVLPAARRITVVGIELGTGHYMAPEQWDNAGSVGHTADQYSLGVISFELLTGKVPFNSDDPRELRAKHQLDTVPSLELTFSPEVNRVIQKALAKEPRSRYRTVVDFADDLAAALRALPRGQLRSLAQVWHDAGRSVSLLLRGGDLMHASTSDGTVEHAFLAASRRHVAGRTNRRRIVVGGAVALMLFGVWRDGRLRSEKAEAIADLTLSLSERERGRAALLHNESDAAQHLARAYKRDQSPLTAFMLARALQPALAEQARFKSLLGQMWSAAFSPDGKTILTSDDRNAQIWDADTHQVLVTLAHKDTVFQAVYSPDGSKIITACNDGAVRLWDMRTGTLLRTFRREGRELHYYALTISPDGTHLAAIDVTGTTTHVWDMSTGAVLAELDSDSSGFPSLAFSADGKWIAISGGEDARVFEVATWLRIATFPAVRCMSWDPTGPHLLTGNTKGKVSVWDVPGGSRIHHLRDLGEAVTVVAYAPDGQLLVAASRDGTEQVWDARSGSLRSQGNYLHGAIRHIEFDSSSEMTVAAGYGGSVAILDAKRGTLVALLDGPRNLVSTVHFDRKAQRVIGASWDGTARIWDTTPPYLRWGTSTIASGCGAITGLEPDRRVIAVGCNKLPTRVWDTIGGKLLAELPSVVPADGDFDSALPAVSANGDRVAIARGKAVEVYEVPTGKLLRIVEHDTVVNAVAFVSSDSEQDLATGAVDGSLLVTRESGAQLILPRSSAGIDAVSFLSEGRLVAADAQRRLRVYDSRGALVAELETSTRVRALRSSPDGRRVITLPRWLGTPASPELWDVEHTRRVARLDVPEQGHVWAATFVAGSSIVTASGDGAARLWESATGTLRQTYVGGSRFLSAAILSPDESMVVGGDADGTLRFWDAVSGVPLWTMPAHRSQLVGIFMEGNQIVTRGFSGDISRWTLPKPGWVIDACSHNQRCTKVFQ